MCDPLTKALFVLLQILFGTISVAGNSGVEITSGLAEEMCDWLEVLDIDCVGERPALPIVEWPTDCGGYW